MRIAAPTCNGSRRSVSGLRATFTTACLVLGLMGAASLALAAEPPLAVNSIQTPAILLAERTPLVADVVHYRWDVAFGPDEFDRMQVHRVLREKRPHRPIRTLDAVLLIPGIPENFEIVFMPRSVSDVPDWDRSFAVYLARHDFDVWGVTFGWALVPPDASDFSLLEGWGIEKDARQTEIALVMARVIRTLTGQGPGPLHLLGFSYGVFVDYAVAGAESQWPRGLRNVKGMITVDCPVNLPEGHPLRVDTCENLLPLDLWMLEERIWQQDTTFVADMGERALAAPAEESPYFPPLTNYDAALYLGTAIGFVAGTFEPPYDLTYVEPRLWIDHLRAFLPWAPTQAWYDMDAAWCGDPAYDPPFDDHIADITLPILYVGSEGGYGDSGFYTQELTASDDLSRFVVSGSEGGLAHVDLFLAEQAPAWVWQPIVDWLIAHR